MGGNVAKSPRHQAPPSPLRHHNNGHINGSGVASTRGKYLSCPEMGVATPYGRYEGVQQSPIPQVNNPPVNIRIHRSYGNLTDYFQERMRQSRPDVRIYRRSTGDVNDISGTGSGAPSRASSIPRNLPRARSADRAMVSNGAPRGLELWKLKTGSLERNDRITTPSTTLSSTSAGESTGSACDLPSLEEVCRKVRLFEESFCHSMAVKFRGLDWDTQMAKVAVATQPGQQLALGEYMESADVPEDLEANHWEITPPLALYVLMRYMRRTGCTKRNMWRSLGRDIVDALAFEVGKELSRTYEFQIVMLKEFVAVKLLAAHAADCVLEYITQKPVLLERNSALRAVLAVRPPKPDYGTTRFSVIVGERELKWDLFDVFKKPGVRREFGLFEIEEDVTYESRTPVTWRFYVCHTDCEPSVYGYRGLLLDWDYPSKLYRPQNAEKLYSEEVPMNFNDFSHQYAPFHRLVGHDPMNRYLSYLNRTYNEEVTFDRYVRHEYGYGAGPGREELFVYRPQAHLPPDFSWELAILENMDLTRLNAETFCCRRVRRSCLALAEYICGGRDGLCTEECDLSYSSLVQLQDGSRRRCRMAYCALLDQTAPEGVLVTDAYGKMMHMSDELLVREKRPDPEPAKGCDSPRIESRPPSGSSSSSRRASPHSRLRVEDGTSQRRKRLRRQNVHSNDRPLSAQSSVQSSTGSDYHVLEAPVRAAALGRPPPKPVRTSSQPERSAPPDMAAHRLPPHAASVDCSAPSRLGQYSPKHRQNGDRENRVILNSGQPPPGDATIRRPRSRHKRSNEIDVEKLLSATHSIKDLPGVSLLGKALGRLPTICGREDELMQCRTMLLEGNRLVVITGMAGTGKSAIALNASLQVSDVSQRPLIPILIDCRHCNTAARVLVRLVRELGVRFQKKDMKLLIAWMNSVTERPLLVFDNLDLHSTESKSISHLFNSLLRADCVQILATSRGHFYRGEWPVSQVRVGPLGDAGVDIMRELSIDLPDESLRELAMVCGEAPFAHQLLLASLRLVEDPASLYTTIVAMLDDNDIMSTWSEIIRTRPTEERYGLARLLQLAKAAVEHLPPHLRSILRKLATLPAPFNDGAACSVLLDEVLEDGFDTLTKRNTVDVFLYALPGGKFFTVPDIIHWVLPGGSQESTHTAPAYRAYVLDTLSHCCRRYHSKDSFQGLSAVWAGYDLLVEGLIELSDVAESKVLQVLVSPRMLLFLQDALAASDLEVYYSRLATRAQKSHWHMVEGMARCGMALNMLNTDDKEAARQQAQLGLSRLPHSDNVEKEVSRAFCLLCLAKARWAVGDDRPAALNLARQALDALKLVLGLQSPLTVYVYEDLALMEKRLEHYQKARYFYNLIDFVAEDLLGLHPALLKGYDIRREIWERQGLFSRAAGVARKAAEIASRHYGDHPLTAAMQSRLCECLVKSGDSSEALRSAILALNSREQLLGSHLDTALSHKMLAYLMLRRGNYKRALLHGQKALDMCHELHVHRRFVKDVEIILAQANSREQSSMGSFVQLEMHRHSRSLEDVLSSEGTTFTSTTITTEV